MTPLSPLAFVVCSHAVAFFRLFQQFRIDCGFVTWFHEIFRGNTLATSGLHLLDELAFGSNGTALGGSRLELRFGFPFAERRFWDIDVDIP